MTHSFPTRRASDLGNALDAPGDAKELERQGVELFRRCGIDHHVEEKFVNGARSDRALNLLISGSGEIAAVIAFEHDQILRRGGCGEKQLGGGRQSSWATGDDPVEQDRKSVG